MTPSACSPAPGNSGPVHCSGGTDCGGPDPGDVGREARPDHHPPGPGRAAGQGAGGAPQLPNALDGIRAAGCRPTPVAFSSGSARGGDGTRATPAWDMQALQAALMQQRPKLAYVVPDFHNPAPSMPHRRPKHGWNTPAMPQPWLSNCVTTPVMTTPLGLRQLAYTASMYAARSSSRTRQTLRPRTGPPSTHRSSPAHKSTASPDSKSPAPAPTTASWEMTPAPRPGQG